MAVLIAGSAHTSFAQAAKIGELPDKSFSIGRNIILFGHHIHHFYIGILLISIAGWFAIVESKQLSKKLIAVMYGIGLGLFLDEIGLLLTWGDYFSGVTYMLSILTFGIFINIVFFSRFWSSLKEELLSAHSHNSFEEFILKNKNLMNVIDLLSEKTSHTTQVRRIFYTLIYFILAGLVLLYPKFIRYWVGGIFITHGLLLLPQIIIEQNGE
ncbi:MAG: hypothetical protein K9M80_08650 [Candidatus Marinimicrobia bacterium]|nr:hypothetical protein [Candidatus Neomarinimicrobiota bacterium]